ncbi:porin family protein [Sinimarinibacterium sp. CAU 1509]|uniref:outer membrane beta-barrel protein n=1 Tax=Sinimarinibacterium sp. CAU 1509 TaxID=2562283 RepID=UPI0010ACB825|nr:outer membrane beta-barrel protein [Sinimarinibacterium sp. CAU 1509]TJY59363.1 porin family protein [Sinimarinibacterium sp. CAU 1509]
MKLRSLLATALLLGVATGVHAQDAEGSYLPLTIAAGPAYVVSDSARDSRNGVGYFASVGVPLNRFWSIEAAVQRQHFDADAPSDPNQWTETAYQLDTQFYYSRAAALSRYVGIGLGYANDRLDHAGIDREGPFLAFGVGLQSFPAAFGRRVGFGVDARYRWLDAEIDGDGIIGEVLMRASIIVALGRSGSVTDGAD